MKKRLLWASEITHWVKELATKPKDPVQTQSSHSRRTELIPDLHMLADVIYASHCLQKKKMNVNETTYIEENLC